MTDLADALKAAAHDYRARGWRVIQLHSVGPDGITCSCNKGGNCASKGKHPRDNGWQKTEPYSAADIEALWTERPKANVGIAVGAASGFWVLDIDPDNGGMDSMAALVAEHGALPSTFVTRTGSGGYHYFFLLPDGIELRNSADRIGKGIDTRADGGQIVAPPSRSDKGSYTVVQDVPIVAAPAWLIEAARKAEVDPATIVTAADLPKPEDIAPAEWERCNRYAKSVVEAEIARLQKLSTEGWEGAPWNHTTFEVSCALIEFANSPWNAYSLDHARNDVLTHSPRDNDGFDTFTVTKTFESALTKVGAQARPVPVDRASEPDPLFDNPDIRRRPTEGDGAADPVVGREASEHDFFNEKDLLAAKLAREVAARGPVGWGLDKDFWGYEEGCWYPDHNLVEDRVVRILGDRFRPAHYNTVKPIVRLHAQPITGDPDPLRINFRNGMLDWYSGELTEHAPTYGSTVQLAVDWNPDATCPRFDDFLAEVMHEDYVELAWEMIGYLMFSGNPMQVAFLLYGAGGNGKGTLIRVIQDLLGHRNVANESLDQLNKSTFSAVNLYGKIANIAGDIDSTYQESTANFKKLVGEDMIGAERKFGDRFNFENWAVPVFSANKIPGSSDVTDGYLRRWIVLHFHKKITKAIPNLSSLLREETEGIAAKAIPSLRTLMARERFEPRGEAVKGKEEFAITIDQVRQWVASGVPLQAPEGTSALVDLYASYVAWAERSGRRKVTEVEFSHRLEASGYPVMRAQGLDYHKGLSVTPTVSKVMTHGATVASFE